MSEAEIQVRVVEHQATGKYRVMVQIMKDEMLDVSFVMTAEKTDLVVVALAEASRAARGKNIIIPFNA